MGKIIKKRIEYGGSSNSAENIKYDDTKNVKEAINEVGNLLGNTDISSIGDGTITGAVNTINSNLTKIDKKNDASLLSTYNANIINPESGKTYGEGSSYRKIGTRVIIHLSIQQAITSGGNTIMTLPVGYRPVMVSTFIVSDGTETGIASVKINKLGLITAYTKSGYIIGEIEFEAYS